MEPDEISKTLQKILARFDYLEKRIDKHFDELASQMVVNDEIIRKEVVLSREIHSSEKELDLDRRMTRIESKTE